MTVSPERIEEALAIADACDGMHVGPQGAAVTLAAALREAQDEVTRLREEAIRLLRANQDFLLHKVVPRTVSSKARLDENLRGIEFFLAVSPPANEGKP